MVISSHVWLFEWLYVCLVVCYYALLYLCKQTNNQGGFYSATQILLFVRIHAAKKSFDSSQFGPMVIYVFLRHRMSSQNTTANQFVASIFAISECASSAGKPIRCRTGCLTVVRRNTCVYFVNKRSRRVVFCATRKSSCNTKPRRSRPERRHLPPKSEPQGGD